MRVVVVKFGKTAREYEYNTELNLIKDGVYDITADGDFTYSTPVTVIGYRKKAQFNGQLRTITAARCISAEEFDLRVSCLLMRYYKQAIPAQLNLLDSHDVSRFLSLCGGDTGKYRLAVLFMMTFVGMPTVFYGDELGLQGVQEEEYRKSMAWEGGDRALLDFFQRAIAMRRTLRPLTRGSFRMI